MSTDVGAMEQIDRAINSGEFGEAEQLLLKQLAGDEANLAALERLAIVRERNGDWQGALTQWERAKELFSDSRSAHLGVIRLSTRKALPEQVQGLLAEYKGKFGVDKEYLELNSDFQASLGDYDGAIVTNEKIVEMDAHDYWAHYRIGSALLGKGELGAARHWFEKAQKIRPEAPYSFERLAHIDVREGKVDVALHRLEANHAANPSHTWTIDHLLKILIARGEYARARDIAKSCYEAIEPNGRSVLDKRLIQVAREESFERLVTQRRCEIEELLNGLTVVDVGAADGLQWQWFNSLPHGAHQGDRISSRMRLNATHSMRSIRKQFSRAPSGPRQESAVFKITDVMSCSSPTRARSIAACKVPNPLLL